VTAACDRLATLLASASVEISSHGHQLAELREHFAEGTEVTITFLPGDNISSNIETAKSLRRAGFAPVPHIAARELASHEVLNDFLARLSGEADVSRVLVIAGDVAAARGPFKSSRDVAASGLLQRHGIRRVSVAGHPEGHPYLDEAASFKSISEWRDWAKANDVRVDIVTQFCFEVAPILTFLSELDSRGIALPVIIGLAGPATVATLTKFALRCGIGNSMRALRGQISRYGRLLIDAAPDEMMCGLQSAPSEATAAVGGFHLFPFGGLRKAANWLRSHPKAASGPLHAISSRLQPNP
jgi:methylenetetrahydrofolate reductase (NADPH)